jgi:hypothetical protein
VFWRRRFSAWRARFLADAEFANVRYSSGNGKSGARHYAHPATACQRRKPAGIIVLFGSAAPNSVRLIGIRKSGYFTLPPLSVR